MKAGDREMAARLARSIVKAKEMRLPLPGIESQAARSVFIEQLIESVRRFRYLEDIGIRDASSFRADPLDNRFDPLRAAVHFARNSEFDEACWLVFLLVHFGKHRTVGWQSVAAMYGRLGSGSRWTWDSVSRSPESFRQWLASHIDQLRPLVKFGNHRKYESLNPSSVHGTAGTVESYVRWVQPPRNHRELFEGVLAQVGNDPVAGFDALYRSMSAVTRFGRTAKFDYLTALSRLELVPIAAGRAYLSEATGPRKGADLLFGGAPNAGLPPTQLEGYLAALDGQLAVGMHVLEDALCNWQKSPKKFVRFRG